MKLRKIIFLLGSVWMAAGCAVTQTLPISRFDSPEVVGKTGKIVASMGVGETASTTIVSDASSRPPIVDPNLVEGGDVFAKFGIGLFDFLEVSVGTGLFSTVPYMATLKLQVLGDSHYNAHANNFSFTLTGSYGYGDSSQGGNQEGIFGPGGYNWSSILITQVYDASVILGYRLGDRVLLFGSGFATRSYSNGSVNDQTSDNGLSPGGTYQVGGNLNVVGETVDLQFDLSQDRNLSLILEGGHSNADYRGY